MDTTRESVLEWLEETRRSRKWLAESLGVTTQAVSNWLRENNPQEISAAAKITIGGLMDADAAAKIAREKIPQNLVLEFTDSEFRALEDAVRGTDESVREWSRRILADAASMDIAAIAAKYTNFPESEYHGFEIPLFHAAAGCPVTSDDDTLTVSWEKPGRIACRLYGESMAPKYNDGATVILRTRESLNNPALKKGEIYLFSVEGEKTLKIFNTRLATKSEQLRGYAYTSNVDGEEKVRILQSINPEHPEIVLTEQPQWIAWLDKADN